MFTKPNTEPTPLDLAIKRAYEKLETQTAGTPEYDLTVESITKLTKLQTQTSKDKISKDVLLTAGVNILGIAMILKHEHANVITTKALAFIPKLR